MNPKPRPSEARACCPTCGRRLPNRSAYSREEREAIARRYLRREKKQLELALEYHVTQGTIARWVASLACR